MVELTYLQKDRFLQLGIFILDKNQTFKPHRHIYKQFSTNLLIANEAWVVMNGEVLAQYYDIQGDNIICEKKLKAGDITMSFQNGGHNYKSLKDETVIYEFKSGPYKNQEWDKEMI